MFAELKSYKIFNCLTQRMFLLEAPNGIVPSFFFICIIKYNNFSETNHYDINNFRNNFNLIDSLLNEN
ncbi:hypothetical protein BpHYR1_046182 [Brachionus plicatilis]|uniref:Uncharacterized protein n=1 Tax=Brachionus plicatilis TaxID=10195 RepID=A0A3M7PNR3_BRAPC|nr:hypothetical protein BpHYR1_046182 [Brachionus plicatilis]